MRRTLPGIDIELGAAVNRVRALCEACPEPWPDVAGERWHDLDQAIDVACAAGDRRRALAAIATWERQTSTVLRRVAAGAARPAGLPVGRAAR